MPSHHGGSSSSSAPARKEESPGISELAQLTRFLLDTAKVEDLEAMLQESCSTPSRKWLLSLVLVSSTASSLQQMLAMLYPEPPEASEVLVRVTGHIESECLLEVAERPSGGVCLVEETTVQGIIIRVLSEDIGGTCETYAADLVRMGIQLPLWTSREMARFSSSPSLQEKVVSWFIVASLHWYMT
ncbi:hypothetical protein AK812_SmicGene11430 [Symbiodinium microadriaticum]|uniref:Uncharacterized protein n=1 Tax=Symbiodinium microadriaticum TaxID=2951 RepID=A0A1Q9EDC1_SYMMI|nr:hypothetical protein AK812_SmicGene11430 [Symbiodinium microadriaticum]